MFRRSLSRRSLQYQPCFKDLSFLVEDVFNMYAHYEKLGYTNVKREFLTNLLAEAGTLATTSLLPLYSSSDVEGCQWLQNSQVGTPKGFEAAYKTLCSKGWIGISQPLEFGGKALPYSVGSITREVMETANPPLLTYATQSIGAAEALMTCVSAKKHEMFLRRLVSGEWSGSLSLTEGQSGAAEGVVTAERAQDGTYNLTGTRNFILAGDHNLTANVLYVVLARLPSSQATGTDLSLFLVPRHVPKSDGSLETERNVKCLGLEATMGMKGSSICRMGFDNSTGYFVGEFNSGVKRTVTTTNTAAVAAAVQGVCHAELAFQNALSRTRGCNSQCTSESSTCAEGTSTVLIPDANMRLSILFAKAVAEGGRALSLDVSRLLDIYHNTTDATAREGMGNKINFYSTIANTCLTTWNFQAISRCLWMWSPQGVVKGNDMEQILRDARAAAQHSGAMTSNSVEFLNRHILPLHTEEVASFGSNVRALVRPYLFSRGTIGQCARRLWLLQKQWRLGIAKVKMLAMQEPDSVGAVSEDVIMYAGYMVLAYNWLRMATVAQKLIDSGKDVDGFYRCKVDVCQYVFQYLVPYADAHFQIMQNGASVMKSCESTWDLR
ncbi:acyl-CoA dehydrogenase, putative [Trypanosoma brucei gambiense DAL972]|uniref:Acyl-CoA dehydrogenase, putative n=1 Tax=Trypanosoma brucei gambiense (strain MHOM/CI/86/DAL972) TaxID=679716 RepID=D0A954_TRYB9|nr:acyl-CoA dehydrogenase, putative [Trypanosoma brucei gambiense DAL972]CBH18205.1 acyl-CoA dehydrogenase, putative [Trypanosoma brucei gambiense DAL972]|eukprot:XP_011780469.1 acyl-CoA dehydrogenase, putative [Trypanosoma brucei gambiense DAL972]